MKKLVYSILVVLWITLISATVANAGSTQTNTSGSNTAIEGGYTGGATTYESGSTSTTTSTNSSTSNMKSAPYTSSAPSIDKTCELIALSTALRNVGMKVASIAILCQDERVFKAFMSAGTPCPTDGKIGDESLKLIVEKYNYEMPTYEKWVEFEKNKPTNKIYKKSTKTHQ